MVAVTLVEPSDGRALADGQPPTTDDNDSTGGDSIAGDPLVGDSIVGDSIVGDSNAGDSAFSDRDNQCEVHEDCPHLDSCVVAACVIGSCEYENAVVGVPCEDGEPCTLDDSCDGSGTCDPGPWDPCDDEEPCTGDHCEPGQGCVNTNDDSLACDDGDPCTQDDGCRDGACVGSGVLDVCSTGVVTKSIGTNGRDFVTLQAWEDGRQGDLTTRVVLAAKNGGVLLAREGVAGTSCAGTHVCEDDACSNGAFVTLDDVTGSCAPGDVLQGSLSGSTFEVVGILRSGDVIEKGEAYNDAPFQESVVIEGSNTGPLAYMWLSVALGESHTGVAGAGVKLQPTVPGHGVTILDDNTRVSGLEILDWCRDNAGSFDGINVRADQVMIEHVMIHDDGHGAEANSDANGITAELDGITVTVINSIVYNIARSGITIHNVDDVALNVMSCTLYSCTEKDNAGTSYGCLGMYGSGGSVTHAQNVVALQPPLAGTGAAFFQSGSTSSTWGASSNNLSSDSSAPGANGWIDQVPADQIISTSRGSEDLHLEADSAAIDRGADLSPEIVDDIDGDERPLGAAYDIGADEAL
ncbi:hypothetical protein ACFL6C_07330 [Myxococcota bacterium]